MSNHPMQDTRATTRWPTRWPQVSIYEKMLALIGPNAPPFARAAFLDELNIAGHGCDEPADFFHVAVDLPGFGYTKTSVQSLKRSAEKDGSASLCTSELLVDIIKSLGKHYAFCIVASSEGAAAVFSALQERPNLASFLILKEPQVRDIDGLHSVFQPTLIVAEARQMATTERIEQALMNCSVLQFNRKLNAKYVDKELAKDLVAYMKGRKWRGHLSGFGHSKMRPLLTRLVGGLRMWSGVREYKPVEEKVEKSGTAKPGGPARDRGERTSREEVGGAPADARARRASLEMIEHQENLAREKREGKEMGLLVAGGHHET